MKKIVLLLSLLLTACLGIPETVKPVENFKLSSYLGTWYEIARLDHSFERGLNLVTANYSLQEDGSIMVINRGFSDENNTWKEAVGKANFVGSPNIGHLKVSFFGPFYASYVIFDVDKENYQYAFISGPDLSYLWLLSRTPTVPKHVIEKFISSASKAGFKTDELIFVNQEK